MTKEKLLKNNKIVSIISIGVLFLNLLGVTTVCILLTKILGIYDNSDIGTIIAMTTFIGWIFYYYHKYKKINLFSELFPNRIFLREAILFLVAGVLLNGIYILFFSLLPESITHQYKLYSDTAISKNIIIDVLIIIVLSPLFEELFFRGLFIREFKIGFGKWWVIVAQSALFAGFHQNMVQIIYTFILGIILGIILYKKNNLVFPILVHFGFNLVGLILA